MHIHNRYLTGAALWALFCSLTLGCSIAKAADAPAAVSPSASLAAGNDIATPAGLTADDVKASVLEALARRKLTVLDQSEGKVSASYSRGSVTLTLSIAYQADRVTIEVKQWDSRSKGVKTQERWLANIRKDIVDALVKRKAYR